MSSKGNDVELLKLAERAVEAAISAGADFADAEVGESRTRSVSIEKSSIHSTSDRTSVGISVRAVVGGATGFFAENVLSPDVAVRCAVRAVEVAKLAEPDPDFVRLPGPEPFDEIPGLCDHAVMRLSIPELIDLIFPEVDAALAVDRRFQVQAGISSSWGLGAFVNSCGVRHVREATFIGCHIFPALKDGSDVGSYVDFDRARRMAEFSAAGLGRSTAETAKSFIGAKDPPSGVCTVVLGPLAAHGLLSAVAAAAGAEGIQRGRSFLAGRLGEHIASECITIEDDGLVPAGLASGALDGDGSVRRRTTIVEKGVFKGMLHSLYTAEKARKRGESAQVTGHGHRGGGVGPTNVRPALGTKTAAHIIAEVEDGIYVNVGGVVPNQITGEISASVDFGFRIQSGKLAYPLKNTMLGINVFELLKAVDAVSSDCREEPGVLMPTLRASGVRVAGRSSGKG